MHVACVDEKGESIIKKIHLLSLAEVAFDGIIINVNSFILSWEAILYHD